MLLVVGSTGTLGRALLRAAQARGLQCAGAARRGAPIALDVGDAAAITAAVRMHRPAAVINCAAITSIDGCERDPAAAQRINGRAPGVLAAISAEVGARFVQISTDHFFIGDGSALHDEAAPVRLVNAYARSKHEGEAAALAVADTLAIRTNFTGWRGWPEPTFIEWAVSAIERREPITGFSDFVTSTIDADALAQAILDLTDRGAAGLYNVAAREPIDKARFLRRLACALGASAENIFEGSVRSLATPRAESLALDVRKAERALGRLLPDIDQVLSALVRLRPNQSTCRFAAEASRLQW
jgi:dTDP-4-dehydrorhamnose reductase